MNEPVGIFLGFDPGGRGNFGWSICQAVAGHFDQIESGLVSNAPEAVEAVERVLLRESLSKERVRAAGIDAPMFWSETGNRVIDDVIRGASRPAKTLAVNSLWGSVLAQGVLLGTRLCQDFDDLAITEAHPKALRVLLNNPQPAALQHIDGETEHEWDARTAA